MDEVRAAAERLLNEVTLHEEVCDCPPDRPSLHHDLLLVARAALSAAQQQPAGSATLAATIEAQRDTELAKMQAARPYSALHSYHEGREEAFSSVLEALAAEARPREASGEVVSPEYDHEIIFEGPLPPDGEPRP